MTPANLSPAQAPLEPLRGVRDWHPGEFAQLATLEALFLDRFARAGYDPLRTPVLEPTELHERKSGAGIVGKLFELAGDPGGRVCLRPELTAGIVRAYVEAPHVPALPWRVSHVGPVFRHEEPRPGHLREFQQIGVELLGASGPEADGEVIWLADWALAEAGLPEATIRIGHVGLILELLERSGLPAPTRAALIEMLSEAASAGRNVRALEQGLEQLASSLSVGDPGEAPPAIVEGDTAGDDRLFRTLVPSIIGRRSGGEILSRLRRKWELNHGLHGALDRVRTLVHELADLNGPAEDVLFRLARDYRDVAPQSVAALESLVGSLKDYGVDPARIVLDLGFGRGIGFYSQMIFELVIQTPEGPVEVCGGGRYDGLSRVLGSNRDHRGVGFALGLERVLQLLDARRGGPAKPAPARGLLMVAASAEAVGHATRAATGLRAEGIRVVLEVERPVASLMKSAAEAGLARIVEVDTAGGMVTIDPVDGARIKLVHGDLARLADQDRRR
ncbi:HisS family protein [Isosphaeraceae bacterium EP7]